MFHQSSCSSPPRTIPTCRKKFLHFRARYLTTPDQGLHGRDPRLSPHGPAAGQWEARAPDGSDLWSCRHPYFRLARGRPRISIGSACGIAKTLVRCNVSFELFDNAKGVLPTDDLDKPLRGCLIVSSPYLGSCISSN